MPEPNDLLKISYIQVKELQKQVSGLVDINKRINTALEGIDNFPELQTQLMNDLKSLSNGFVKNLGETINTYTKNINKILEDNLKNLSTQVDSINEYTNNLKGEVDRLENIDLESGFRDLQQTLGNIFQNINAINQTLNNVTTTLNNHTFSLTNIKSSNDSILTKINNLPQSINALTKITIDEQISQLKNNEIAAIQNQISRITQMQKQSRLYFIVLLILILAIICILLFPIFK